MKTLIRSVDLSFIEKKIDLTEIFLIQKLLIPQKVSIPIEAKNIKAEGLVKVGDDVKTGQIIAAYKDTKRPKIISTITGKINSIAKNFELSNQNKQILSIEIVASNSDEKEEWFNLFTSLGNKFSHKNWQDLSSIQINQLIQNAQIVGMGGAGFPTHLKINPVEHLIINAVECEPLIYTDFCLMRQKAQEIIKGIEVIQKLINPSYQLKSIHLAIKAKNKEFIKNLIQEIELYNKKNKIAKYQTQHQIKINYLSNNYPSGGEKQIIEQIFNREIAQEELAINSGFLCLNVATVFAIEQAIIQKKACVQRLVTIYNQEKQKISNAVVRIGTPLKDIIKLTGLDPEKYFCIIGGPMMGFEVHQLNATVSRITNCIQIVANEKAIAKKNYDECIRCGLCSDFCPVRLLPQQLYWSIKNNKDTQQKKLNLFDCIECGICDYVCPSNIPLLHYFRYAKNDLNIKKAKQTFSDLSKERFEFREYRLERAKQERIKQLEEKRKQMKKNKQQNDEKKALIQKALNPNSSD